MTRESVHPQSQTFVSNEVDDVTMTDPITVRNKLLPSPDSIYMDGGSNDKLQGYVIASGGIIYGGLVELIVGGYNHVRKCIKDIITKRLNYRK